MPGQRLPMRKIRDVLRLSAGGMSKRKIAISLSVGAPTLRLIAILRLDMPPALSRSTSRILRIGNLCPGMPSSSQKELMPCRFEDHPNGARHVRPQPGRNRPERVVAINRNAWSQSVGTGGRNHPVRADNVLMRITEIFQVIPRFFLALLIAAIFGASIFGIIFIIGILSWPEFARLIRAEFLAFKERPFVTAARAYGAKDSAIIWIEIMPNAIPP